MYLETIKMSCGMYSITPELGDLYDVDFFCNCINITRSELEALLKNNGVSFSFHSNVLCFKTKKLAEKAMEIFQNIADRRAVPLYDTPVA